MLKATANSTLVKIDVNPEHLEAFFEACSLNKVNEIKEGLKNIFPEGASISDLVQFHHQHVREQFFYAIFGYGTKFMAQYFVLDRFFQKRLLPVNQLRYCLNYLDLISSARKFAGLAAAFVYFDHLSEYHCSDFSPYEELASQYPPMETEEGVICYDLKGELGQRHIDDVIEHIKGFILEKTRLETALDNAEVAHDVLEQLDCQIKLVAHWMALADEDLAEDNDLKSKCRPGASFSCWKASFHMASAASLLQFILKTSPDWSATQLQICQTHAQQLSKLIQPVITKPIIYCYFNQNRRYPNVDQCNADLKVWSKAYEALQKSTEKTLSHHSATNGKTQAENAKRNSWTSLWSSTTTLYRACFWSTKAKTINTKETLDAQVASNAMVVKHNDASYQYTQTMRQRQKPTR
jgi:hypothetical protein